jgi:hypothetical protein
VGGHLGPTRDQLEVDLNFFGECFLRSQEHFLRRFEANTPVKRRETRPATLAQMCRGWRGRRSRLRQRRRPNTSMMMFLIYSTSGSGWVAGTMYSATTDDRHRFSMSWPNCAAYGNTNTQNAKRKGVPEANTEHWCEVYEEQEHEE